MQIHYANGLLTLQAENVDITRALDTISREAGVNILYGPEVRGPVSAQFKELPVLTALTTILDAHGFLFDRRPDHLYVYRGRAHLNIKIFYDEERELFLPGDQERPPNEVLGRNWPQKKPGENLIIYSNVMYMINSVFLDGVTLEEAFSYPPAGHPLYLSEKRKGLYLRRRYQPAPGELRFAGIPLLLAKAYRGQYVIENLPHFLAEQCPAFPGTERVDGHRR